MFCVAFSAEKLKRQIARLMESNQQLQHYFACDINNTIPSATSATHMIKLHFLFPSKRKFSFLDPEELRWHRGIRIYFLGKVRHNSQIKNRTWKYTSQLQLCLQVLRGVTRLTYWVKKSLTNSFAARPKVKI